jgi:hypothetical protein
MDRFLFAIALAFGLDASASTQGDSDTVNQSGTGNIATTTQN